MRKYRKLMVAGVLASLAILTLAFSATALASSGDEGSRPREAFQTRVSEILGLEDGQLSEAQAQAKEERREEAQAERLAQAVEDGVITQEEAEAISAWFDARPEVLSDPGVKKALCQRDGMKHRGDDSEGNSLGKRDDTMCRGDEQQQLRRR